MSTRDAAPRPLIHDRLDLFAMGLLVVLCACWGLNQVAIKLVNAGISPVFQATLRSAGAMVCLFAYCRLRGIGLFERDRTFWPGIAAGALFAAEFIFLNWGLVYTTAARGVVLLYLMPFVVAIGAHFLIPLERLTVPRVIGLVGAFAGVVLAFSDSLHGSGGGDALVGDAMMVAAAVFWGATTLVIKTTTLATARAEKTLLYQLAVSAVVLLAVSLALREPGIFAPTPLIYLSLAYQTFFVVPITYVAWFWLMKSYPAAQLSAFTFFTPLFGVLFGGLLLGEAISAVLVLSLALVAAGIYLVNRPARPVLMGG